MAAPFDVGGHHLMLRGPPVSLAASMPCVRWERAGTSPLLARPSQDLESGQLLVGCELGAVNLVDQMRHATLVHVEAIPTYDRAARAPSDVRQSCRPAAGRSFASQSPFTAAPRKSTRPAAHRVAAFILLHICGLRPATAGKPPA